MNPTFAVNAAVLVGLETILQESKIKNYLAKEIYLLTDGERTPEWDFLTDTAKKLQSAQVSLMVMSVNPVRHSVACQAA